MISPIDGLVAISAAIVRHDRHCAAAIHLLLVLASCAVLVPPGSAYAVDAPEFEAVKSAVVRIAVSEQGHSGVGTIVTAEGHIILHGAGHLKDQPLIVILPDGRRAKGVLLGWSTEWNVGLAKITDPGPWPFVEMATTRQGPEDNDACFTLGYLLEDKGWSAAPQRRSGQVTKSSGPPWFTSSVQGNPIGEPYFAFGPVFNDHGKLLGNTAVESYGHDSIQLHVDLIQTLWQELLQGDVDQKRLFSGAPEHGEKRPYQLAAGGPNVAPEESQALRRAVASTVGLQKKTGIRWSGVIISPDGWVATCAHGGNMPGDQVVVELSDGRVADAIVTGANPITDIALIKIEGEGPWPFAELSENSDVAAGTPCWFVGYPAEHNSRVPLVRKTSIVHPDGSEGCLLYTDAAYSQSGGDSGGGVFDLGGRLLGLNQGKELDAPGRHPRIETLRLQWSSLADPAIAKTPIPNR